MTPEKILQDIHDKAAATINTTVVKDAANESEDVEMPSVIQHKKSLSNYREALPFLRYNFLKRCD